MKNKNIPDYVLKKGISKDDFVKICDELKRLLIDDVLVKLNDYNDMIDNVRKLDSSPKTDRWISNFQLHVSLTDKVINNNVIKIEKIFNKIFEDWDIYLTSKDEVNEKENVDKTKDDLDNSLKKEVINDAGDGEHVSLEDENKNIDEEPILNEITNIDTIEGDKDE